jgi:hypothetical protein
VQKLFQPQGIAVEHWEELFPGLTLVLGLAAAEGLGERASKGVQASVDHIQIRADIGGFGAIEKRICLGCVGVEAVVSLEHAEGDEHIEEVAGAARVELETLAQFIGIGRTATLAPPTRPRATIVG